MDSNQIKIYLFSALCALVILTFHEFAHGYAAYKMGDNTAKNLGRLTFNPLKHLDPVGALCIVFFRVGWAKPVPVNPDNFKNRKRGFAIVALAGPLTNIVLGFLTAGLYSLMLAIFGSMKFESEFLFNLASNFLLFLYLFFIINIGLGLFNLLPIPPFDGSRLAHALLPEKYYFGIMKYERKIYMFTLLWLLMGNTFCMAVRSIPFVASVPWLYGAAGILSLSGMISTVIGFVCDRMLDLWQLIPFLR